MNTYAWHPSFNFRHFAVLISFWYETITETICFDLKMILLVSIHVNLILCGLFICDFVYTDKPELTTNCLQRRLFWVPFSTLREQWSLSARVFYKGASPKTHLQRKIHLKFWTKNAFFVWKHSKIKRKFKLA